MCGRFINLNKVEKLKKIFEINGFDNINNLISYNIAPSQSSIIVTNHKSFKLEKAKWGFNFFDKLNNIKKSVINSRIETIDKNIFFIESFEKRKCLIPANGYFEWTVKNNTKVPYFINVADKETIYFAGIWKYNNFESNDSKVFSIITKPTIDSLKKIHHRMPFMLSLNESIEYLNTRDSHYLQKMSSSILEEYIEYFQISKFVNNPFNNSEKCIKPII